MIEQLIQRAQDGEEDALNQLCAEYRPMLRLIAEHSIGSYMSRRTDPSDIVQLTTFEAVRAFSSFRGTSEGEFVAWVKQILKRRVANEIRHHRAARRDLQTEQSTEDATRSTSASWLHPVYPGNSPSQLMIVVEEVRELKAAMKHLPANQRAAVSMRHFEQMSLRDIAGAMQTTPGAVAGLVRRGLQALRDKMMS